MTARHIARAASAAAALVLAATGAHAAELIHNGGFETGDFTGWTATAVTYPVFVDSGIVHSGHFAAKVAGFAVGPDTLEQDVADVAGQSYTLSFWRWMDPFAPNGIDVTWNGVSVHSETDNVASAGYEHFSFTVTGHGSDALVFTSYNDPAFNYFDDVSVRGPGQGVPEPGVWSLMIGGFGLAGGALRRRRALTA